MKKGLQLFTLSVLTAFIFFPYAALASNVHGTFRVVKGDVKVKSAKGKLSKARIGQKVFPQDTIITGTDSRAKIVMIDNNVINVSPASEIVFEKYEYEPSQEKKDVLIDVIYGKVRSKVNQKYDGAKNKFRVKTPSAVAGVRGTDFITSFNKASNSSQVVTFEGEVQYGLPGADGSIRNAVSVKAGQMASNAMGKAPSVPKSVPKSQLANLDKGSDAEKSEAKDQRQPADDKMAPKDNEEKGQGEAEDNNTDKKEDKQADKKEGEDNSNKEAKSNNEGEQEGGNGKAAGKKDSKSAGNARGPGAGPAAGPGGVGPDGEKRDVGANPPKEGMGPDGPMRGPASAGGGPGLAPAPGFDPAGGSMLTGADIVGGSPDGFIPEANFITGEIPDFNAINTDASRNLNNNFNPCLDTCTDIIRDVIEGGNTRLIIRISN
ncbi:MAG: FecR domain-containing protein [Bdellovibrionales bacterium]|nr:FecR domain-containing protein [Bdellovibrionales bacterium]